jgi:hypothetical protein
MFIQIIQGRCRDEALLRRQMEAWQESMAPSAPGFLGGTYGLTDGGEFIGVIRFESREAAARNSERPEQDAWWTETSRGFEGEVSFHDADDALIFLDGGSDDAGFVQVIQGRLADPERLRAYMSQPMDTLHEQRPEIIGGTIAIEPDGTFTQTVAFRSEAEARAGEHTEMPPDAEWAEVMATMQDLTYRDLPHPWFASAVRMM